eukprot:CAMPEP_0183728700 /NCGR_PEP_ID=MMETSP0737-20130205/28691_1 /TAXON_ID=385413 /ORGANISM="Thalassiosira miniscula, Strain CCMP1093" /LENGTH=1010 /DNA_ID=CAMNT_0025960711 /DNA_START=398 /DNA_END=3430 /DNA_ORIENTATION=-
MDAQLTAPRTLTSGETEKLRKIIKAQLSIESDDDDSDAENMVDYAVDMIEEGENIGHVTDELQFMELPICGEDEAEQLGVTLTKFLSELDAPATPAGGGWVGELRIKHSKMTGVPVTDDPTPESTPEPELDTQNLSSQPKPQIQKSPHYADKPKEPELPQLSLKDRLSAYQGSGTGSGTMARSTSRSSSSSSYSGKKWGTPSITPSKSEPEPVKEEPQEPERIKEEDELKDVSLKERLSAYQTGATASRPSFSSPGSTYSGKKWGAPSNTPSYASKSSPTGRQNGDKDSSPSKESEQEKKHEQKPGQNATGSVKDRLTAYKRTASREVEPPAPKKEDAPPMSLKERMASYQDGSPTHQTTKELTLKDRMSAYQSPSSPKKELSLKDRMSAFSSEKKIPRRSVVIPPDVKKTDLQERMSKFSQPSKPKRAPFHRKESPPEIKLSKEEKGSGLQERMAVYKQQSAPAVASTTFVAKKKPPTAKRLTYTPKKPAGGSDLELRMAALHHSAGVSPDAQKKELSDDVASIQRGGSLKDRMSNFQAKSSVGSPPSSPGRKIGQSGDNGKGGAVSRPSWSKRQETKPAEPTPPKEEDEMNKGKVGSPYASAMEKKKPGKLVLPKEEKSDAKVVTPDEKSKTPTPSHDSLDEPVETNKKVAFETEKEEGGDDLQEPTSPSEASQEMVDNGPPKSVSFEKEEEEEEPLDDEEEKVEEEKETPAPPKISEEKLREARKKELEDEQKAKRAELESFKSEMKSHQSKMEALKKETIKTEKFHKSSLSAVEKISTEIKKLESAANKADVEMKSLEAKTKKKGLLGGSKQKKAKKDYETAVNVAIAEKKKVEEAKSRLAAAQKEADSAKSEFDSAKNKMNESEKEYGEMETELERLSSAVEAARAAFIEASLPPLMESKKEENAKASTGEGNGGKVASATGNNDVAAFRAFSALPKPEEGATKDPAHDDSDSESSDDDGDGVDDFAAFLATSAAPEAAKVNDDDNSVDSGDSDGFGDFLGMLKD